MKDFVLNSLALDAGNINVAFGVHVPRVFIKNDGENSCYVRYWRDGDEALDATPTTGLEIKKTESVTRTFKGDGVSGITICGTSGGTTVRIWGMGY
jgi:hypothetical protein